MRPDSLMMREWLSYILLVGIGGALYPQAIQRIYSARSANTLKRSFAAMAFMPFISVLISIIVGIYALAYIPGLEGADSDQAFASILRVIQESSLVGYALVVMIFSAVLAALMSTADSAMLSISSMFTKDIYLAHIKPDAKESELTRLGKRCSWAVVAMLTILAILLKEQTSLISLLDRKFDLLIQIAPDLEDNRIIRERYFELIISRLEKLTNQNIKDHIIYKKSYGIRDFKKDYHSFKGNAYGLANTLFQTAIYKPSIRNKKLKNLYFCGQLTVPGPGVPPSLISGNVVANELIRNID